LKHYAPFDALPEADLLNLAGSSGKVQFHESEEYSAGRVTPNDRTALYYQTRADGARIDPANWGSSIRCC